MENKKETVKLSVKDKKHGRIYPVLENDDNEDEDLNYMMDPHFWGPGYGDDNE